MAAESVEAFFRGLVEYGPALLVLATALLVVASFLQAAAAKRQAQAMSASVAEMERARLADEDARAKAGLPQVVLYFDVEPDLPELIYVVLQNYGHRPAYDVTITPDEGSPPLATDHCPAHAFPTRGVRYLVPGQALRAFFVRRTHDFYDRPSVGMDYTFKIKYYDGLTALHFESNHTISLWDFYGIDDKPPTATQMLAKTNLNIKRIADHFDPWNKNSQQYR